MRQIQEPTEQEIRIRAHAISQRANGGTPEENWRRAKEELRDEAWAKAHEKERPTGP
jgi:hypothetical protein